MTRSRARAATWVGAFAAHDVDRVVAAYTEWIRGSERRRFLRGFAIPCAPSLALVGPWPFPRERRPDGFIEGAMAFLGKADPDVGARMDFAERCQGALHAEERRLTALDAKAFTAGLAAGCVASLTALGLAAGFASFGLIVPAEVSALAWACMSLAAAATAPRGATSWSRRCPVRG